MNWILNVIVKVNKQSWMVPQIQNKQNSVYLACIFIVEKIYISSFINLFLLKSIFVLFYKQVVKIV